MSNNILHFHFHQYIAMVKSNIYILSPFLPKAHHSLDQTKRFKDAQPSFSPTMNNNNRFPPRQNPHFPRFQNGIPIFQDPFQNEQQPDYGHQQVGPQAGFPQQQWNPLVGDAIVVGGGGQLPTAPQQVETPQHVPRIPQVPQQQARRVTQHEIQRQRFQHQYQQRVQQQLQQSFRAHPRPLPQSEAYGAGMPTQQDISDNILEMVTRARQRSDPAMRREFQARQLRYSRLTAMEKQKQDEWAWGVIMCQGACPMGFQWNREEDKKRYRCAGLNHDYG